MPMPGNIVSRLVDRMGHVGSSLQPRSRTRRPAAEAQTNGTGNGTERYADSELTAAKKLIQERPNVFILNNLLLSIHLFSNYEMEMEEARNKLNEIEAELNNKLLPEKSVLLPDVMREHFTDRIRFTSNCKSDKNDLTIEPLRPIKIYTVFENVVVTEKNDTRHYSDPTELTRNYNFILKEASQGYARLEQSSVPAPRLGPGSDTTDLSSIVETEEIYSEDESVYGPVVRRDQRGRLVRQASTSMPNLFDENENSAASSSRPDNGATNGRRNPRQVRSKQASRSRRSSQSRQSRSSASSSSSTTTGTYSDSDWSTSASASLGAVLSRCMKRVTYTHDGQIYNARNEPKRLSSQQRRIREAKLARNYDVVYVNGYEFAKHFMQAFRDQLGELLNFDETELLSAKRCDATIRLEKIGYTSTESHNYIQIEQYEVIPCFRSPWPDWARGWLKRNRGDWPKYEDLLKAKKFTCCLVPEGARPLDGKPVQSLWKLNWNFSFPGAERYLETCFSASQATVLTIALMLHKTFVRAVSSSLGLEPGHIRNLIFWMVEKQPEWSELEMGGWMMKLLESLHSRVQQHTMLDYFMHNRDLFANASRDELLHAQKQLKRIIENPVMFVFHAMEKIEYVANENEPIIPRLNYRELQFLLTENELVIRNPALENLSVSDPGELTASGSGYSRRESERDFWTEAKIYNEQYAQTRKRSSRAVIKPLPGHDSIIDIQDKCGALTRYRLSRLLVFFADHFLKMASCCHELGAERQKQAYVKQICLLADLLAEDFEFMDMVRHFHQRVREIKNLPVRATRFAPETPRRNSQIPVFPPQSNGSLNRENSVSSNGSSKNVEETEAT